MTPMAIKPINVGRLIHIMYILSEYTGNETYIVVVLFLAVIIAYFLFSYTTRTINGFTTTSYRTSRPKRFIVIVVTVIIVIVTISIGIEVDKKRNVPRNQNDHESNH